MKKLSKILGIGLITTLFRLIAQLLIPGAEQSVLAPSVFVQNGTVPLFFSLYAFFMYSIIAAMFLLIRGRLSGNRFTKGIFYGLAYCVVWVLYLFEPLPHGEGASLLETLSYPVADGLALLLMGGLLGAWLTQDTPKQPSAFLTTPRNHARAILIGLCFTLGRLAQYTLLRIYSSYQNHPAQSVIWAVATGLGAAYAMLWLLRYTRGKTRLHSALTVGFLLFGVNLLLFNASCESLSNFSASRNRPFL